MTEAPLGYYESMNFHFAVIAILTIGLAIGCTEATSDGEPKPRSNVSLTPDSPPTAHRVENVDAAGAAGLIAESDEVIILDIRTPSEFQRGHLEGAINIDYTSPDYAEKLAELDKEKTYLVH